MSIETSVEFNENIRQLRNLHMDTLDRQDQLKTELNEIEKDLKRIECQVEDECAKYIDRFDQNKDGKVTPMEILKSIFRNIWTTQENTESEHIIKAMFVADTNGDTVVDLHEFTNAIKNQLGIVQEIN